MRAGNCGWTVSEAGDPLGTWKLGRPVDLAWPKKGWGTPFSGFRFAIPEYLGYAGKAIYLDADMLVLGDLAELWDTPTKVGYTACHQSRTDVSIVDCGWFKDKFWWPRIAMMKASGWRVFEYIKLLVQKGGVAASLPWDWNDCDGQSLGKPGRTVKLEHFTNVRLQPYRPYPSIQYSSEFPYHPNKLVGHLWWDTYEEALIEKHGEEEARRILWKAQH